MAFDPDKYLANKTGDSSSGNSFDPDAYLADKSPPTKMESGLRGAAQGLTLQAEPVIAGGASSGIQALKDAVMSGKISLDDIKKNYQTTRDSENKANDLAEKTNPWSYGAGNLAGGAGLAIGTAGAGLLPEAAEGAGLAARLGNAAQVGALVGAGNGLGSGLSNGQDLGDTSYTAGKGALVGSAIGPVAELGISGIKSGLSSLKNGASGLANEFTDTNTFQKFKKAFGYGLNGTNLTSKSGLEAAQTGVQNAAENLGMAARDINKSAGAGVGAAKQALQDNGSSFDLNPTLDKIQSTIVKLKESDHPSAQNDANFLQKYLDNLTQKFTSESSLGANADSADFQTANDVKQALTDFGGTSGNGPELKTTDALNSSKLAAQDLQNQIVGQSPDLSNANQKASASYKALNALGVDDSSFETNPLTVEKQLTAQGEAKLGNTVRQVGRGSETQAGSNANNRLNTSLDYLKSVDPDTASQLQSQVTQAGEIHSLAQQGQGNLFGKGLFNTSPIQAGNKLGRLVSTPVNTIAGAVKGASNTVSSAAQKVSTAIQPLTDNAFGNAAKSLVSTGTGVGMKLGSALAKGIGKDSSQKNAILFGLMQTPGYRAELQKHFGNTDNETEGQ